MKVDKSVWLACAMSIATTPAWAGFAQGNQVTMGGTPVFSIAAGFDGFSPEHRAWITQDRLDNALVSSADKSPDAVQVVKQNGTPIVMLGGYEIATADGASAASAGMSAMKLASKWAANIKNFLADSNRTTAYLAELTGRSPISAQIALAERRMFAPPGTILPIALTTELNSETIQEGCPVEGSLVQDVACGNFVIPCGSKVCGRVNAIEPDVFTVTLSALITPNGTKVPIAAIVSSDLVNCTFGPHLVATEGLPYGNRPRYLGVIETNCKLPAHIGIGTLGGGPGDQLLLRRGTNIVIAPCSPISAILQAPTLVAVVMRNMRM